MQIAQDKSIDTVLFEGNQLPRLILRDLLRLHSRTEWLNDEVTCFHSSVPLFLTQQKKPQLGYQHLSIAIAISESASTAGSRHDRTRQEMLSIQHVLLHCVDQ